MTKISNPLLVEDFYKTELTLDVAATGDVELSVTIPPENTRGFIIVDPDNTATREKMYYHDVIGNIIYVKGVNRVNPCVHYALDNVQINDTSLIFNYLSKRQSTTFFVEQLSALEINVFGGPVLKGIETVSVEDTILTVTNGATNYIYYKQLTNEIKTAVSEATVTTDKGIIVAEVIAASGTITSTSYRNNGLTIGISIYTVELTSTSGLVDTYTITYTDSTTSTFNVTNGSSIASIDYTSSVLNVDTYTVTLTNGNTTTFEVTNGTSISSVLKTGTVGFVDTYTITLTDNSTTTFEVTNGADGLGVPSGGTTGQVLVKASDTDNDTEWGEADTFTRSFELSEDMTAGELVKVINDGKISKITDYTFENKEILEFYDVSSNEIAATLIDTNKVFIVYREGNYGQGQIITIVGKKITYGEKYQINTDISSYFSVTKIDTNKVFISYVASFGYGIVATISGTVITYGTKLAYNAATTTASVVTEIDTDKVFIFYRDGGNSYYSTGIVGTISGTTITYGAELVINTVQSSNNSIVKLETNKVFIAHTQNGTVATVSGTTITKGSSYAFNSTAATYFVSTTIIDTNKVFIGFRDSGNSNYGTGIIATISSLVVAYGSKTVFNEDDTEYISVVKLDTNKVIVNYENDSLYGMGVVTEISGNIISYGDNKLLNSSSTSTMASVQIDDNITFTIYSDGGNSNFLTGIVFGIDYSTLLGQVQADGVAGETQNVVMLGGVSSANSGLTPGDELNYGTALSSTDVLIHRS